VVFTVVFRLKITGLSNLPETGGFIIASNHNSLIDPPLVGSSIRQPVYFMAKKELFKIPVFGRLITATHAFPVNREFPGPSAIKKAIGLLRKGKVLLVFPEGTRKSESKKIHKGVALLAHKAGVPVIPAKIHNNRQIYRLRQLKFEMGGPINFSISPGEKAASSMYADFSEKIMSRIISL
jgi:1-acyl-sn-glycerol-3-phosphate acyltransferase